MTVTGTISRHLFGIPSARAVFSRPGFAPEAWQRFEPVAHSLVEGYHASLENPALTVLVPRLDAVAPELRGFAYEGAGMALAALDVMAPWKNRLQEFVDGAGGPHIYPVYVGVGMALARLKRRPEPRLTRLDPLLNWVVVDGYGFHAGFFSRRRYIDEHAIPPRLSGYAQRVFDQGLGRAIWFSHGAVVERVASTIAGFQPGRHADIWSGVGLACAYGGGADRVSLLDVCAAADPHRAQLARGAATAAWGREQAGNQTDHTDLACAVFCGLSSQDAARVLDDARENLPADGAYEAWRRRTEARLVA